jgi:Tfp pilus assembly protein PilO
MTQTPSGDRRSNLKAKLVERLHDPLQLRILLIGAVLAAGYFGVYTPLTAQIAETTGKIGRERKLAELADSLEHLQTQVGMFAKRLPYQADSKEWLEYMHEGIRGFPVKLYRLDCLTPRRTGPYQVVVLQIEVGGSLYDLDKLLRWLETNARLFRVDDIMIGMAYGRQPSKEKSEQNLDDMVMRVTVLGLAG